MSSMRAGKKNKVYRTTSSPPENANLKGASVGVGNWSRWRVGGLLAVMLTSLVVNCVGLGWGRSGLVPWQPDSIEGITTVREMQRMFGQWTYKYPRGHFLINAIFYQPLLEHWEKHPIRARTADGRIVSSALNLQRLDVLAKISRIISVVMGTGTVFVVFLISRLLFRDYLAALLAALALAVSQLFVFYSHVGNVDIPYIFWFACAVYCGIKAVYTDKCHYFILLGLFSGYSVCTKEAVAGYVIGLGIAIWIAMVGKALKAGLTLKKAILAIFSPKVLVAILAFSLCFAVLNGFLAGPEEFFKRMGYWKAVPGKCATDYTGQLHLLYESGKDLYYGLGWPLLTVCAISVVYCAIKYRWQAAFGIIPLLAFYLITITNIRFVGPRFMLAGYPGLALLAGKAWADCLRWKKIPKPVCILPLGLVYILSLFYCIGLDLELLDDSRVRMERWFYRNVAPDRVIGVGIHNRVYAPRLHFHGYRPICPWRASSVRSSSGRGGLYPEYLIMPTDWPRIDEEAENIFRKKLFDGELNYERMTSFRVKYLYPARTIFGFAGWPIPKHKFISPEMVVFKKKIKDKSKSAQMPGTAIEE